MRAATAQVGDPNPHFGDYQLQRARGKHHAVCAHCGRATKPRPYAGLAEQSMREHIRDVHDIASPRRDVRQTTSWQGR